MNIYCQLDGLCLFSAVGGRAEPNLSLLHLDQRGEDRRPGTGRTTTKQRVQGPGGEIHRDGRWSGEHIFRQYEGTGHLETTGTNTGCTHIYIYCDALSIISNTSYSSGGRQRTLQPFKFLQSLQPLQPSEKEHPYSLPRAIPRLPEFVLPHDGYGQELLQLHGLHDGPGR